MADDGMEQIGGVSVKVVGDFSSLDHQFQAAVEKAVQGGATLAEAIESGLKSVPGVASAAAESITGIGGAAAVASGQVRQLGDSLAATTGEAAAAGGGLQTFGTVAESIEPPMKSATESMRSMISEIRGFTRGVFVFTAFEALGRILTDLVTTITNFGETLVGWDAQTKAAYASIEQENKQLYDSFERFKEQQDAIKTIGVTDAVAKSGVEMENTRAAIGRVNQELAINRKALAEAEGAHQSLATVILGGTLAIKLFGDKAVEDAQKNIPLYREEVNKLTQELRELSQVKLPTEAAHQAAAAAEVMKDHFKAIPFAEVTGGMTDMEIANAVMVRGLRDQQQRLEDDVEWLARYQEALAAGTTVLRASGESTEDWAKRSAGAKAALDDFRAGIVPVGSNLKEIDDRVKEGATAFKDMREAVASTLTPAQAAAQEWAAFDKALSQLHLHDTDEQLQQMAQDLATVGAHAGIGSKDYTEGVLAFGRAIATADKQVGDLGQDLTAKAFTAVPEIFSSIENSLASNLVHWKGWSEEIKRLFEEIAQKEISTILGALFQPLQQQIQQSLANTLLSQFTGSAAGGGTAALGTAAGTAAPAVASLGAAATAAAAALGGLTGASGAAAAGESASALGGSGGGFASFAPILGLFAEGTDYVPRSGVYHLDEGEAVVKRSDNLSRHYNASQTHIPNSGLPGGPGGGTHYHENASVGSHFDFRGSTFTGVTNDLVEDVFNKAVKKMRRVGTNI